MNFRSESLYNCENPRLMWRVSLPLTGMRIPKRKFERIFCKDTGEALYTDRVDYVPALSRSVPLIVRCGKCEHCRKYQNDEWASRMIMESISHKGSMPFFITLSFDTRFDSDLSVSDKTSVYRNYIIPFKKRLRSYGVCFRYYCVSELGEVGKRFHFHLVTWVDLDNGLVDSATKFAQKYAPLSSDYFESCRLFVKGADGKYRLQTDLECYVQYLVQRAWSENTQRYACAPVIKIHHKDGRRVKSVEYPNQIGWVSCSQSESFGACYYITSYSVKCLHDGVVTYHRQSPGLGSSYVEQNIRGSLDMLESGKSIPDCWTYSETPFLLPRFFIRKFMPVHHRIRRMWSYLSSLNIWDYLSLVPKIMTIDNWKVYQDLTPPQFYMPKKDINDISLADRIWLETLDQANDLILSRRAKKVDVHKLFHKNLKNALCTQSKETESNTFDLLTLF